MKYAQQCVVLLGDFLNAAIPSDWLKAEQMQQLILIAEKEADKLKSSIRCNLPRRMLLPVARSDLLELISIQDRLANRSKDIAGLMLGRKIEIPSSLAESFLKFYNKSLKASYQALKAINELDELLETGFRGREVELVVALIAELDRLEKLSDVQQIDLRASLYELESELPPIQVMFLDKIIDLLGEIADDSQKVGNRLLILIA